MEVYCADDGRAVYAINELNIIHLPESAAPARVRKLKICLITRFDLGGLTIALLLRQQHYESKRSACFMHWGRPVSSYAGDWVTGSIRRRGEQAL